MPSYVVSIQARTRDGSTDPGRTGQDGLAANQGVVMVTTTDAEAAKREGAEMLGVSPAQVVAQQL